MLECYFHSTPASAEARNWLVFQRIERGTKESLWEREPTWLGGRKWSVSFSLPHSNKTNKLARSGLCSLKQALMWSLEYTSLQCLLSIHPSRELEKKTTTKCIPACARNVLFMFCQVWGGKNPFREHKVRVRCKLEKRSETLFYCSWKRPLSLGCLSVIERTEENWVLLWFILRSLAAFEWVWDALSRSHPSDAYKVEHRTRSGFLLPCSERLVQIF